MPTPVLVKYPGMAAAWMLAMVCLQAGAAAQGCGDPQARSAAGAVAIDGDTFRTADGQEWRLAGVLAPKRSDGARAASAVGSADRPRFSPADAARQALDGLVKGQSLWLKPIGDGADRYGRRLTTVRDAVCGDMAAHLLAAGHLRVYPAMSTRPLMPALYAAEARARREGRGLWADARYRVLAGAQLAGRFDGFVVVEDRVSSISVMRAVTVMLFGPEQRRDFGVTIEPKVRKLMRATKIDPANLVGRQVRVRGWLRNRLGAPDIELAVPEQLEVVEP